jgi:hypothetical protein
MHELAIDGVCRFCRRNILFEASENMSAPALSPEERAERAWEAQYPINTDLHRFDSLAAQDVKDGFIAGYLARDKENAK